MECRRATVADVPRLVQLAQLEHARSRFSGRRFDRDHTSRAFEHAVGGLATLVLISASGLGFIGGMVQPNLFNRYLTAYELAWYAEDGSGIALLEGLTTWARKMRAVELVVSNFAHIKDPQRFARVMARRGFDDLGMTFIKNLEP
jgi:hypothetical protein